ncbi:NUMOD4 domain-containing protein [[Clostridium] sordellii]|uniref:NUMOD4 domain-containing protein n=1 Tax=Paraclostridium sordellii TaxID=1505 RepID=UPI0005DC7A00|nr:NUMOD4 domain-containing protein [Paeniclostridium sordellii]CEP39609.1 NUMOD4 domain-containing protein [[Clostridium] sordellii] [Paeniclostridium sordellii]
MTIYLYDPRYNLKQETTYEKLSEMFGIKKNTLMVKKSTNRKILSRYYIIDDKTPLKEIRLMYEKETFINEVWKEIEGSEGIYLISNYGRFKKIIKKNPNGKIIMPYFVNKRSGKNNRNKQFIKCKFKGIKKEYSVARLVAYHFVEIYYEDNGLYKKGKAEKYKKYKFEDLVVYHKNGILYDNYHANLEFLDKEDLGKKTGCKSKGGKTIVAIDALTNEVIDYFKSTRHVERNLPISRQTVSDHLNGIRKNDIAGGRYLFRYES